MNRFNLVLVFYILSFFNVPFVYGAFVNVETAQAVGYSFIQNKMEFAAQKNSPLSLNYQEQKAIGQNLIITCFYVFSIDNSGFIIIAADDAVKPILGYSTHGDFDISQLPPNFETLLNGYTEQIVYAVQNNVIGSEETYALWQELVTNNYNPIPKSIVVNPLIQSIWKQGSPYNSYCPEDINSPYPNGRVPVGCVATAMAQIMNYWSYPTSGMGSHGYYADNSENGYGDYGYQYADFANTTYQYSIMPDEVTDDSPGNVIDAVATLCYQCGVAVEMKYGPTGSGAYSLEYSEGLPSAEYALKNYFGFVDAIGLYRDDYSQSEWLNILQNELLLQKPVFYAGSGEDGGHAFIIDGFDSDELFHVNWGWGGYYNGYYEMDALSPETYSFNENQKAIMNIRGIIDNCPEESLGSNPWGTASTAVTSEASEGYAVATQFTTVGGIIETVHIWMVSLFNNGSWNACDGEENMTVDVHFIENNVGAMGDTLYSFNGLNTIRTPAGINLFDNVAYPVQFMTIQLPSGVDMNNGFMLIQGTSVGTPDNCWLMWIDNAAGSGSGYQYNEGWVSTDNGFTYCLEGTPPDCAMPSNLAVSNPTINSIDLSWDQLGDSDVWDIEYGQFGFTPTGEPLISGNMDNPITISGLDTGTIYDFYVRAQCNGSVFSDWTGPVTGYTNNCESANQCAYSFGLIDSYGDGWNGGKLLVVENGITIAQVSLAEGFEGTQEVVLCDTMNVSIIFVAGDYPEEIGFTITDPNGTELFAVAAETYTAADDQTVIFTFTSDCPPLCPNPTDFSVITSMNSAEFSWNSINSLCNIQWGSEGFTLGEGYIIEGVINDSYSLSDLIPGTNYSIYIQSDCGGGMLGDWMGPYIFATKCGIISDYPYYEGFENTSIPPSYWYASTSNYSIGIDTENTSHGNNAASVTWTSTTTQKLTSEAFGVTPGANYYISVDIYDNTDAGRTRIGLGFDGDYIDWNAFNSYSVNSDEYQTLYFEGIVPAGVSTGYIEVRFYDEAAGWSANGNQATNLIDNIVYTEDMGQNKLLNGSFEFTVPPTCWSAIDADGDGMNWESIYSSYGEFAAASASWDNTLGVLSPDNWMISPQFDINADNLVLSFFRAAHLVDYSEEKYSVLISTTDNNIEDFVEVYTETILPDDDSWQEVIVPLFDYHNEFIYVAIRHWDCSDMYKFKVDSFKIDYNTLSVDLGEDIIQCGGSAILDAGDGFVSYVWNGVEGSNTFIANTSGTYTVIVEDVNGLTATDEINVTIYELPNIFLGNDTEQCGGTVTLNAGSGFDTYTWNGTSGNQTFTATETGTYTVVVEDENGCTATDAVDVIIHDLPTVNLGDDIEQCGGSATLNAGSGFSTYIWNGTSGNQTLNITQSGIYTVLVQDTHGCTGTDAIEVNIYPLPQVNLGSNIEQCGGSLILDAGSGFDTYSWNGISGTQTYTTTESGTYTVLVEDANGCTASDAIDVSIYDVPTVDLGDDVEQCGGSVTLDAGSGFDTYTWNGTTGNQTHTVSTSNTYTVLVENSNGCTATDAVDVSIYEAPEVDLGDDISICNGSTATLDAGPGFYIYLWNGTGGTSTHTVSEAGTYEVQVFDSNGCTASDEIEVSILPSPTISLSITEESTPGAADGSVTASPETGMLPFSYSWDTGAETGTVTGLSAGQYCVTVSDGNGCSTSDCISVTVADQPNPPVADFTADATQGCDMLTVQFTDMSTNNPTSWNWQFGDGTTSTTENPQHTYTASGVYTVSLTVSNDDGTSDPEVKTDYITVGETPQLSMAMTQESSVGAADGTATVTANGGWGSLTYVWDNSETGSQISGLEAGTYCVTVTDEAGCSATDCIEVSVMGDNYAAFTADVTEACAPMEVQFTDQSTGNVLSWTWNFGDGGSSVEQNPAYTYETPGTYTVSLTVIYADGSDTHTESDYITANEVPELSFNVTDESAAGASDGEISMSITGGESPYIINWSNNAHTETIIGLSAGTYSVAVIDANGCAAVGNATVEVDTDIAGAIADEIKIYPNPVNDELHIISNSEIQTISVFDITGKLIIKKAPTCKQIEISLSEIQSGVYFVEIECNKQTVIRKIVKD